MIYVRTDTGSVIGDSLTDLRTAYPATSFPANPTASDLAIVGVTGIDPGPKPPDTHSLVYTLDVSLGPPITGTWVSAPRGDTTLLDSARQSRREQARGAVLGKIADAEGLDRETVLLRLVYATADGVAAIYRRLQNAQQAGDNDKILRAVAVSERMRKAWLAVAALETEIDAGDPDTIDVDGNAAWNQIN